MRKEADKELYDESSINGHKYEGKWGMVVFVLGVVLLSCGFWLSGLLPQRFNPSAFTKLFSFIGILTGAGAISVGYFSYPRIHNLKVFLSGHVTGISSLAFCFFSSAGIFSLPASKSFIPGIYLLMIAGILTSALLPTFLKYRWTKRITISVLLIDVIFLFIFWKTPFEMASMEAFRKYSYSLWLTLLPGVIALATLVLSVFVLKRQFFLGGVMGGMAVFFGGGWYFGNIRTEILLFDSYVFAVAPFFFVIGVFIHWLARMEHRASYDPLLRVYNRSYCERILDEQTKVDTNPPFGIAIVDIDRFKNVNDKYGHRAGDEVLLQLARILTNEVVPDGIVCRYGGEEFVIFFPRQSSTKIKMMMELIRKKVKRTSVKAGKKRIRISISAGISHRQDCSLTLHKVFRMADKALYRAKREGRNQVRFSKTE
ncbi:diguanylate cyclase [candidate division WOR-3 bacterium]|nr:diguanylate cyclase [candidate division WOR-3 bacterium]